MSESGVKNAVAQRVVRPHELQQWHRNWNGTPNRKVLRQHNIETAIEYLPRPRQWLSPLSASPAKMRAFYPGDDTAHHGPLSLRGPAGGLVEPRIRHCAGQHRTPSGDGRLPRRFGFTWMPAAAWQLARSQVPLRELGQGLQYRRPSAAYSTQKLRPASTLRNPRSKPIRPGDQRHRIYYRPE